MAREDVCLVCRLNDRLCALPIAHVAETMRLLPVHRAAEAPSFVLGLSVIRGEPAPVVDAGLLLSGHASQAARLVIVRIDRRQVALAVDAVLGVREISSESMAGLPPLLGDAGSGAISALGALDRELLFVLNSARIVPDSLWAGLESRK